MLDFNFFYQLVLNYWYLGIFLLGLLSSATLFLPTPAFIVVFLVAKMFDPFVLGFVAGMGAGLGELTSYGIGYGGSHLLKKKYGKRLNDVQKTFEKYRPELVIFVFSATPLPFDFVGIFCGVIKYPLRKLVWPLLLGKIVKYWFIAYAGYYGITWISQILGF